MPIICWPKAIFIPRSCVRLAPNVLFVELTVSIAFGQWNAGLKHSSANFILSLV